MRKIWFVLLLLMGIIMACNLPGSAATTGSSNAVQTAAAMTVAAALQSSAVPSTQMPLQVTAAPPPTSQPVDTAAPSPTPAPTNTPQPPATATPRPCNLAHFITDVTVSDGTVFTPGQSFTKTWRLQNVGTCTWQNYSLVFDHGDAMGASPVVPISGTVAPGQQVDISVNLTAPATPGEYKGYWRLRDSGGVVFGLTTGNPFWVDIKVEAPTATPTLTPTPTLTLPPPAVMVQNMYAEADLAKWYNANYVILPFPGATNDSRGFARYADGVLLEDGHTYTHVLETHPQWVPNGFIAGRYPPVSLPANTHFRAHKEIFANGKRKTCQFPAKRV